MKSPNRLKQLIEGLLVGAIVLATIMWSVLLSSHDSIAQLVLSPSPVVPGPTISVPTHTPGAPFTLTPTAPGLTIQPTEQTATSAASPAATPTVCVPPPGWQRYIVGPFDTLASIAQRFHVNIDLLAQVNCLTTLAVTLGQVIYVPSTVPTVTPVPCIPPFNWVLYYVQPGDTLSSIARGYGISVLQLMQANCLTSTVIYVGQILRVPPIILITLTPTASATPTDTPTPTPTPSATPTGIPSPTSTETPTTVPPPTTPAPITDTPTPTGTLTPTPSPSPTARDTPVPPTPTDTLALTNTPTPSPSPASTP